MNGYTTMSLFTLPIGFKYGGWLFSPIILLLACFVETFAAVRLIQCAREVEIY
jgi:amino acid permease